MAVYGFGTGTVGVETITLIHLRSCAILYLPVFCFSTGKIGVFQADWEGSSTPAANNPSILVYVDIVFAK